MTLTDKLSHAAERKAFETILDNLIKKGQTQDAAQALSRRCLRKNTIWKGFSNLYIHNFQFC